VTALPSLPEDLCALARFVSAYYQQPIGQCFAQLLPPLGASGGGYEPLAPRYRLTASGHAAVAERLNAAIGSGRQPPRALMRAEVQAWPTTARRPSAAMHWAADTAFAAWRRTADRAFRRSATAACPLRSVDSAVPAARAAAACAQWRQ